MRGALALAVAFAFSVTTHCSLANAATPPTHKLDRIVDDVIARYKPPGLALGIIENGEVIYTRSVGERRIGSGEPINNDTLFKIASNSKAMTTSMLARLVQAGKLDWNDPVTKYLPDFKMYEPWVTRNMQVRDLLIHNSGMREGAGDLMLWPNPNHFTRKDIIAGLAFLKPQHSFRSQYAYDNLLYVVAGEVAAVAGGAEYETLMRREVFEPLGLSRCQVGTWTRDKVGNVAQAHRIESGKYVPPDNVANLVPAVTSAAAGGIRCSLSDMLIWAVQWLAPTEQHLVWLAPEQRRIVWTAQMPMPISERKREWNDTHFYAYGYGWRLSNVDDTWVVSHTGTLSGVYSALVLLPETDSGFVFMINGDAGEARTVLRQVLLKHFTAPADERSVQWYAQAIAAEPKPPTDLRKPDTSARRPATAVGMETWTGIWRDPWFGEISICPQGGRMEFASSKSPMLTGQVMRVGERYLVDWTDASVDAEAWLDFAHGAHHAPPALHMAKVDPQADFSYDYEDLEFTRVRGCMPESFAAVNLVDVRTLVPRIELDMRYASDNNFVGERIDGYLAPRCYLLRPAAEALAKLERDLRSRELGLKIFDCYRPVRAVQHFVRWAGDMQNRQTKAEYYPNLDKGELLGDYIAPVSGHSRGDTLDLTIMHCPPHAGTCEALDMGTRFDFFDPLANTESPDVSPEQHANRIFLRSQMQQAGFRNYPLEWWHYTYVMRPPATKVHDLPIR